VLKVSVVGGKSRTTLHSKQAVATLIIDTDYRH